MSFLSCRALAVACLALLASIACAARPDPVLRLAWLDAQGRLQAVVVDAQGRERGSFDAAQPVPLGSLWKLVAYAQWVEAGVAEQPLQCKGRDPEEVYCCAPGDSIARGAALARSCGLYFAHDRVPWERPAGAVMQALPAVLAQAVRRGDLGPQTRVSPREWLAWLDAWPPGLREQAQHDLLAYWVNGAGVRQLGPVAAQLRVKTYTVEHADGTRTAGASGWTAQDRPLWFAAAGSSTDVVPGWAGPVLALTRSDEVPRETGALEGRQCVRVEFFARYPIATVEPLAGARLRTPGSLRGRYRVHFASGTAIEIESAGELQVANVDAHPVITGDLALEDYVARVIDREAAAQPQQAAWALAVAARSYVLAQATPSHGCLQIEDSTATQRVSPRPATAAALQASRSTAGLVLAGGYAIPGQYHRDQGRDGVLSWRDATAQAGAGEDYLRILHRAYPRAGIATAADHGALACDPLPLVLQWIEHERPRWKRQLAGQPGFEDPGELQVCRLARGRAHAGGGHRIDVAGYRSLEERIAVAHEYVHLAFAGHPAGRDEAFVEAQARKLLGVLP